MVKSDVKKTNPLGSACANLPSVCSKSTTLLTFISVLAARIRWVSKHLLTIPHAQAKLHQQRKALAKQPKAPGEVTSHYIKNAVKAVTVTLFRLNLQNKMVKEGCVAVQRRWGRSEFQNLWGRIKGEQFQVNARGPRCGRS